MDDFKNTPENSNEPIEQKPEIPAENSIVNDESAQKIEDVSVQNSENVAAENIENVPTVSEIPEMPAENTSQEFKPSQTPNSENPINSEFSQNAPAQPYQPAPSNESGATPPYPSVPPAGFGYQPYGYRPPAKQYNDFQPIPPQNKYPPYYNQPNAVPPFPPNKTPKSNNGLRVFCIVLGVLVLASICLTAGYLTGENRGEKNFEGNNSVSSNPFSFDIPSNETQSTAKEQEPPRDFKGNHSVTVDLESRTPDNDPAVNVFNKVSPSVVGIVIFSEANKNVGGSATGIIISSDGYVVTNDHIYSSIPSPCFLIYTDDGKEYEAEFVAGDARNDLAVLKMNASGFRPATFGNSDQLSVGENVVAIGTPYSMQFANTITKGIVSAVNRRMSGNSTYPIKVIQTDTAINPGNSGGPLVDMNGNVIGINSSKIILSGFEGIGFAIPSSSVKRIVEDLIKYGYVQNRSRLGITYRTIDSPASKRIGDPSGLLVESISPESDMNGKGCNPGDIITKINGIKIENSDIVLDVIENAKPGTKVKLTVYSSESKKTKEIEIKLIEDKGSSSYEIASSSQPSTFEE